MSKYFLRSLQFSESQFVPLAASPFRLLYGTFLANRKHPRRVVTDLAAPQVFKTSFNSTLKTPNLRISAYLNFKLNLMAARTIESA